jgi:hypothetical protein
MKHKRSLKEYIVPAIILIVSSYIYNKYKKDVYVSDEQKDYALVKKYLLNDEALDKNDRTGKTKKPIIWIHQTYEVNARWWPSFGSRNTDCLNQPYQYLTMKSIIDKCGNDFNICLIDDDTFPKILPSWAIDLSLVADPIKTKIRELALAKTLYMFGGFLLPASFICFQNLFPIYNQGISEGKVLIGELLDRTSTSYNKNYAPSTKFMACDKDCQVMKEYIYYLENLDSTDFTSESIFLGSTTRWYRERLLENKVNIMTADKLGVKDIREKPIGVERLLGNSFIEFPCEKNMLGLYIPSDEIIRRTAYQWFSRLSAKQALASDTIIGKYLLISN